MSEYMVGPVLEAPEKLWKQGLWLVLLNPHQKPPHLGLMAEGLFYSLTHKEFVCGQNGEILRKAIDQKRIPVLMLNLTGWKASKVAVLENAFGTHNRVQENLTCFSPIKESLMQLWNTDFSSEMVHELIPEMETQNRISGTIGWNLSGLLEDGEFFRLRTYSLATIYDRIADLNENIVI